MYDGLRVRCCQFSRDGRSSSSVSAMDGLGLKVFELARIARVSYGLSELAIPILRDLAQSTGETALLTRRSGNRTVCLEREEPPGHLVRLTYERGAAVPLNAGASSLVLLAWEDPDTVHELLGDTAFPRFTDKSLTKAEQIVRRLAEIRADGYSVSRGELDPDATGIAAPVRDDHGRVVAGVSVVAVSRRMEGVEDKVVAKVREAADRLTELVSLTSH